MVINQWDLPFAYVIWLDLTIVGSGIVIAYLVNPPYHQLMKSGIPKEDNIVICKWLGQEIIPSPKTTLMDVSKKWQNWVLVYIYFETFGGFMALTAYLPLLNTEYHGSSSRNAGIFTAMYSIGASLSRTASGRLVDRFGGGKCSIYGQSCILFGSIILAMSPPNNMNSIN